jgi:hypothetical protein
MEWRNSGGADAAEFVLQCRCFSCKSQPSALFPEFLKLDACWSCCGERNFSLDRRRLLPSYVNWSIIRVCVCPYTSLDSFTLRGEWLSVSKSGALIPLRYGIKWYIKFFQMWIFVVVTESISSLDRRLFIPMEILSFLCCTCQAHWGYSCLDICLCKGCYLTGWFQSPEISNRWLDRHWEEAVFLWLHLSCGWWCGAWIWHECFICSKCAVTIIGLWFCCGWAHLGRRLCPHKYGVLLFVQGCVGSQQRLGRFREASRGWNNKIHVNFCGITRQCVCVHLHTGQELKGNRQDLWVGSGKGRGVAVKLKHLGGLCKEKGIAMDGVRYGLQQASWENSSVRLTLKYYHPKNTVDVVFSPRSSCGGLSHVHDMVSDKL